MRSARPGVILWISNHFGRMTALKRTLHAHGFGVHKVHVAKIISAAFGATAIRTRCCSTG